MERAVRGDETTPGKAVQPGGGAEWCMIMAV